MYMYIFFYFLIEVRHQNIVRFRQKLQTFNIKKEKDRSVIKLV